MSLLMRRLQSMIGGAALALIPGAAALAQDTPTLPPGSVIAQPKPWQWWVQPSHSPVEHQIVWLNLYLMAWLLIVLLVVAGLLAWVLWRYNAKRHPVATKTTHNAVIEVLWTLTPILFLIVMTIPSLRLVFYEDRTHDPYMTVKVTGHQWYWEYTYPGENALDYTSYMIPEAKLKPGQPRLLTVDHPLVVPVDKDIRILMTSADVLHAWFIPSLGVQRYAIPGAMVETWFRVDHAGLFYGECNQVCGTNHDSMPIEVIGLPMDQYKAWVKKAQAETSSAMATPMQLPADFSTTPAPLKLAEAVVTTQTTR